MAKSLQAVLEQIERLTKQAEALKAKEKVGVIARIKEAIKHYDIQAEELFAVPQRSKGAGAKAPVKRARRVPTGAVASTAKYADGNGNVWTGRGPRPGWFKEALAAGKTPEQLLVSATA